MYTLDELVEKEVQRLLRNRGKPYSSPRTLASVRLQIKYRLTGRCRCSRKVAVGRRKCEKCLDRDRVFYNTVTLVKRNKRKSTHCPRCDTPKYDRSFVLCQNCRERKTIKPHLSH